MNIAHQQARAALGAGLNDLLNGPITETELRREKAVREMFGDRVRDR